MNILHIIFHSLVRGTPARISAMWGRYTSHNGKAISVHQKSPRGTPEGFCEFLNPYGYRCLYGASKKVLRRFLEWADVIHCHDDCYPIQFVEDSRLKIDYSKKILVYHAHIGDIPRRYFNKPGRFRWDKRVLHACITNGYGHLFDADEKKYRGRKWHRLPDILDLNHPTFRSDHSWRSDEGRISVAYTYSNHREDGKINAKRPKAHRALFNGIRNINYKMLYSRPFEESMTLKKAADVVIDEVFSPYFHLSAIEGAAVGAMVITNYNDATRKELCDCVGSPIEEFPFFKASNENLKSVLSSLDKKTAREWGNRAQEWMHEYYRPELLLRKYLDLYAKSKSNT